ncbi:translocation/assembly module TamB domain-containing protein [Aureimonas psammosilenae]|uniref:translocation/assembly module TamB domain-containing protein n=1 Tax=Aureimonas psammosilenae TaxID=2495496 RepID=UPI0012612C9E|nr:translocation/assembly module TamB domain-containing protein [Aureimonas psammosilenae]
MRQLRFFIAIAIVTLAFAGFGREARAQEFIARQIENLVSTDSLKVQIDGLSGALTGNLRINSVTVSDPKGPFLTARDLAMDWSPLQIARRNIAVQSLTAGQISFDRLPELPPSPATESSGGGLPNFTADIQRLAITEFVLGEAVAGTPARLSLDAKLVFQGDPARLETNLNLNRLDQPGRVAANVLFAPAENRLDVNVDAGEPAGGLVASLLKIPGAPPVQLTVTGSGPLDNFAANGALNVGNEEAARLQARVEGRPEGRHLAATLNVAAERFAPEAVQPYVKGGANLDANVLFRPDGVLGLEAVRLSSDVLRLDASGTLDRAGPQTALDLALASPDGGPIPLRFGEGTGQTVVDVSRLQAKLAGALAAANIDLSANLPQAGYGPYAARDLALSATARGFDLQALSGPLSLTANAGAVVMPDGIGQRFTEGRVTIDADGSLGNNSLTLANGRITTGAANAAIQGTAALNFSTFDLTLSSDFQTLALSAALVPLAGERTQLSGRATRDAAGTLGVQDLALRGTGLTVNGSARLSGDEVQADVRGNLDVQPQEGSAISGKADFALLANGPTAQPNVDLSLNSQGLRVNGRELANLKAEARGSFTGQTPRGSLNLTGTLDGQPLSGTANLATLPSGDREISDLAIRQGPNNVTGDLKIGEVGAPVGRLDVDVEDIGPLAALALQQASGDLSGRIDLSVNDRDFPLASVNLTSNSLTAAGNTLTDVALDLDVEDYLGKPLPSGTIRAQGITAGGVSVEGLTVDLSRAGDGTRLDARATANGVPVELAGVATLGATETAISLEKLTAAIPNAAVSLAQASQITLANGTTTIQPITLNAADGSLRLQGTAGETLNLSAELDRLPAALANAFVSGIDASGTLSGTARVEGPASQPNASFDLSGTGITAREVAAAGVPPIELRANGTYADALLTLREARATIGSAFLQASGTAGETLNVDARLSEVPVALANGFVSGLKASGTISGSAALRGTGAAPTATFDVSGSGISAAEVRAAGIPPAQLRVEGAFADGTADLRTAVVNIGEAVIQASGRVGRALDLNVRLGEVPVGLANAFVPGLNARGTISGDARATGAIDNPNATFALTGQGITAERIAASGIAPLTLDIAGNVANKTATIERGRVNVGEGFLDVVGTIGQALDVKVDMQRLPVGLANGFIADLDAGGTLTGSAAATGSLSDPAATFRLSGDAITTRQIKAASLRPVELDLSGRYAGGTATLDSARATIGEGSVSLSGTVGRALDLDVALDDLPVAIANGFVPNLGASGTLSGSAEATGSVSDPQATFEIEGRQITTTEARKASVPPLSLDLSGRYAGGTAEIGTARIAVGDGTITATGTVGQRLDIDVTLARLPVALANGFVPGLGARGTLNGKASATGSTSNPAATFDIRADDVSTTQTRAARAPAIDAVANGRYENGAVALQTARVTVGSGTVDITGRAGQDLDLQVAIRNLPASLASAAASGIDPTGSLNGTARATGPASNPNAEFDLNLSGFTIAQTRQAGVGPLGITANGRYGDRNLQFDTRLTGGGGLNFTAGGRVGLAGTPQFDIRANGTAPLALANRILAEGGRAVQGTARIDVAVSGTAAAPNVNGTISTTDATFTDTGANVAVRNIATTITLSGQTATISSFRANLAAGGTITAGGTLGLTNGFPADIQVRLADGRYSDGEIVAIRLNAALSLTGQLTATPLLAGSIDVRRMDILVPARFPTSLSRIDVKRRNAPPRVAKQQNELFPPSKGGGGGGGINLDIAFNAPSEIFVRGRGLDAQLGGSLRIQGSASAPAITGGFELRRGRLVILNKRLDFQSGTLSFTGDLIPLLDFVATSDTGDVTVQVAVTGPANDPSFNFSSSPALPQDEVLARLIFNQGTTNLSPLQIAQLAEAAAQLAGVGGSTGLLENLRSQLGVDDLDVRTTADGQTAVGVGKYLNDRTYLGVDSTGRASINIDIGKGLKASGAVTAEGGGEVGIFYEKEY